MASNVFYLKKRVKNIFNKTNNKVDLIIIKNSIDPYIDDNFFYISGLTKGIYEGSIAILYPSGDIELITSQLELESAKKSNLPVHIYNDYEEYKNLLEKLTTKYKNIGYRNYIFTL